jgi:hypothetical protein
VLHPGSAGTSAQKPPSSALWTIALIVMRGLYPTPQGGQFSFCRTSPVTASRLLSA